MSLSNNDKKEFRRIGHELNPVVIIAQNGLSENIMAEIDRALESHELIKVKIAVPDRSARKAFADEICTKLNAVNVQSIGQVILLYRKAKNQDRKLSNLVRHSQR